MNKTDSYRILALLFVTVFWSRAGAQTAGPNSAGTITATACMFTGSGANYTPAANAATSNNMYATVLHCGCCDQHTNCLRFTNFGFSIPATSVITGITVEVEKKADFGSYVEDNGMALLKGGVEVGNNYSMYGVAWPYTDTYVSYGGCTDLWGETWTPADINAANFGFEMTSIDYSCAGDVISYVDHVRITICYNSTLPVELSRFDAKKENNGVKLEWEVFAENNCQAFTIEHSVDGVNYNLFATVPAKGIMGQTTSYSLLDQSPFPGVNYYRLWLLDHDGNLRGIEPVVVNFDGISVFDFKPFWDDNTLVLWSACEGNYPVQVTVYNLAGEQVFTAESAVCSGTHALRFTVPEIPRGIYGLSVSAAGKTTHRAKIFKAN
ncbi:MAG TPA: hypothetical protein VD905_13910 [Flavobacteriales bacterium]|nr:hypothetical protein [Flavobacteriales bacterium]